MLRKRYFNVRLGRCGACKSYLSTRNTAQRTDKLSKLISITFKCRNGPFPSGTYTYEEVQTASCHDGIILMMLSYKYEYQESRDLRRYEHIFILNIHSCSVNKIVKMYTNRRLIIVQ